MQKLKTEYIITGLLLALTLLFGAILSNPSASADTSGTINISVEVPSVCSLSMDDDSHSVTMQAGTQRTIGTSIIKAVCNDPDGLAVYAVGYGNETYGENRLIGSFSGNPQYIPSNASSGTPSASEWNMTLTAITGAYAPTITTGYTTAHAIPTTYTKVAYRNSATDVDATGYTATGANFSARFDVYAAPTQLPGTYQGKVKFLLVHPNDHAAPITPVAVPHQICYYGNNEDEGSMACQTTIDVGNSTTAISVGTDVQLRASNFSRAGYGFTGWNTKEDGSGTQYGPMETITFTQDMYDNGLMLFANWKAAETGVTMQTFDDTASPYSTAPNGTVIALRDIRDNDVYAVAKLADGKWWMIENLRLDYDANITTSNTQSNNGAWGGAFAGLATPESANFTNSTTANSLYTTDTSSTDLRIITGSNQDYRFPRYNNANTASRTANNTTSNTNIYGYGNYYTWPSAVADTTRYTTNNQFITSTSLCPTGWHLPKGSDKSNEANNEWWTLTATIIGANPANYDSEIYPYYKNNSNTEGADASKVMRRYPTNLVYSGHLNDSTTYSRGAYGYYWSSTVYSNSGAYLEYLDGKNVYPGTDIISKYYGQSVRCLAD